MDKIDGFFWIGVSLDCPKQKLVTQRRVFLIFIAVAEGCCGNTNASITRWCVYFVQL